MTYRGRMKLALGIAIALCVGGCSSKDAHDDYMKKSKLTEAELNLNAIGKAAKAYYAENAAFPDGKADPTPAAPCCGSSPDHTCPANAAQWLGGVWEKLDFEVVEAHRFQYSYEGSAERFTARAVGDLDCDGTTVEYVLEGMVQAGSPILNVKKPDRPD